jgi:hypothetical protein
MPASGASVVIGVDHAPLHTALTGKQVNNLEGVTRIASPR